MERSPPSERLEGPLPLAGRHVLLAPEGNQGPAQALLRSPQTGGLADLCQASKPHGFIVPPRQAGVSWAAELVGGVGLAKDIFCIWLLE
jgi:hypothetical protein